MSQYSINVQLNGQDNLTPTLEGANQELDNLEGGAGNAEAGLGGLTDQVTTMVTGFIAFKAIGMAGELNQLGDQANDTETTFDQLAGKLGNVNNVMDVLRSSTGGIIDDMSLQGEASRILSLHLADNTDELGGLVSMGEKLAGAMGKDAKEGIDELVGSLASGRFEGLRQLGIDGDAVKLKVDSLTASGYSARDAFKKAVWDEGNQALRNFGQAALVAEDGAAKLQNRLDNIRQDLSQGVNNVVDSAANTFEQLVQIVEIRNGTHPMQEAAKAPAKAFVDGYWDAVATYMDMGANTTINMDAGEKTFKGAFTDDMVKVYEQLMIDPTLQNNRQQLYDSLLDIPHSSKDNFIDSMLAGMDLQKGELGADASNAAANAVKQQQGEAAAKKYLNAFRDTWNREAGPVFSLLGQVADNLEDTKGLEAWKEKQQAIADAANEVNTFKNSYADMPPILDVNNITDVGTLNNMLADAKNDLVGLQDAAKEGLISESDLEGAQKIESSLQSMQENITKINQMGLGELFGQTSGGSLGEIQAAVSQILDDRGVSKDKLDAFNKDWDLGSGKETLTSQEFQDNVAPTIASIAQDLGKSAAENAMKNLQSYLENAKNLGLTDEQTAQGEAGALGYTVNAKQKYGLGAGSGDNYMQQDPNFDVAKYTQSLTDTKDSVTQIATDTKTVDDNMVGVNNQFMTVDETTGRIRSTIEELASKVHKVTISVDVLGLDKLNAIVGATGGTGGTNTRQNGGRPPDADPRAF